MFATPPRFAADTFAATSPRLMPPLRC